MKNLTKYLLDVHYDNWSRKTSKTKAAMCRVLIYDDTEQYQIIYRL
jgi:hypothetical protein